MPTALGLVLGPLQLISCILIVKVQLHPRHGPPPRDDQPEWKHDGAPGSGERHYSILQVSRGSWNWNCFFLTCSCPRTAAEVIAAVKRSNLTETGESSGSDDGGSLNQTAPFVFSNPYRDGGNLMGLDKFPTFQPLGYNPGEIMPRPPCGPIGSGRPGEKITTPGV